MGGQLSFQTKKITSFAFSSYQLCDCLPYSGQKHFSKGRVRCRKKYTSLFLLVSYLSLHNRQLLYSLGSTVTNLSFNVLISKMRELDKKISLILCPSWVLHFLLQQYFLFIASCSLVFSVSLFRLEFFWHGRITARFALTYWISAQRMGSVINANNNNTTTMFTA